MIRPFAITVFLLLATLLGAAVVMISACSIDSSPSGTMVMSAPYPGSNEMPSSKREPARTGDYSTYTPPPAAPAPSATTPGAGHSARPTVMTSDKNTVLSNTTELATFGAGCFWGVEHLFRQVPGVVDAVSGYSGGRTENPTYKDICTGRTGHAEVVQVEYDPARVGYEQLLEVFWSMHDPTQLNRQGPDFGTQYRSAIFFHTPEQEAAAKRSKEALQAMHTQERLRPVVTEITPASTFYRAEEYHQRYVEKHGEAACPTHFNNSGGGG